MATLKEHQELFKQIGLEEYNWIHTWIDSGARLFGIFHRFFPPHDVSSAIILSILRKDSKIAIAHALHNLHDLVSLPKTFLYSVKKNKVGGRVFAETVVFEVEEAEEGEEVLVDEEALNVIEEEYPEIEADAEIQAKYDGWTPYIVKARGIIKRTWNELNLRGGRFRYYNRRRRRWITGYRVAYVVLNGRATGLIVEIYGRRYTIYPMKNRWFCTRGILKIKRVYPP